MERKVGRLLEIHKRVAYQYKADVLKARGSTRAKAVKFTHVSAYEKDTRASGGYVLRTSHTDWPAAKVARTYWRLADTERTFRTLKSELGIRPIYHSKDQRIETHIFLSVLACHPVQLIRTKLQRFGLNTSWARLQHELNQWMRITTILPTDHRNCILLKNDADLSTLQRHIALTMGLKPDRYAYRTQTKDHKMVVELAWAKTLSPGF